ncbi:MAG: methionyl-tRNA formyltransferase [Magnetococcales bacterium]|nr:methionyl-tRNA formyltransferase [Magnetococcales bacterium]
MGTPDFAVPSLAALLGGPDPVVGVVTQLDKPTGRGMAVQFSPVKRAAMEKGIPLLQPRTLRDPETFAALEAWRPDLVVVAAFGQILPEAVLNLPAHGCINVHASLLPRWRGAAPIARALLAGDSHSGVTIMQMEAGLDTGPVLAMERLPLDEAMTGGRLHDALAVLGARLLVATIAGFKVGSIRPVPQSAEGVVYAAKLTRADERIDFRQPAGLIRRRVMALNPWPGAVAELEGRPIKIFDCRVANGSGLPGTLIALHNDGPEIACGEESVIVREVQVPGKRRMTAQEWLRGHPLAIGMCWS